MHSKVVESHGHLNQWCLLPPRTTEGSGVQMGRRGQQGKGRAGHSSHCSLVENLPCGPRSRGATSPSLLPQPHHCHCSAHLWASKESPWTPSSLPLSFLVISSNHLLLTSYPCLGPHHSLPSRTWTPRGLPAIPCVLIYLRSMLKAACSSSIGHLFNGMSDGALGITCHFLLNTAS